METASIIELGIAELAPLKIMTFCTWSGTVIDVIKDFNDSSNLKGYVEHFQLMQGPTGGNRDGFAIRIAGAELAKRPEKTKILIVISDGQPSDYCRKYESGIEDVHNSILELNKRGIETFGIYIERDLGYMDRFRYMYGEKRSLVCSSNELPIILPRLIRQNLR